jgi:histidine kinase
MVEQELRVLVERLRFFGQSSSVSLTEPLWQMILNLMGQATGNPCVLTGTAMNQEVSVAYAEQSNKTLLCWIDFCSMELEYLFGNYEAAEQKSKKCIDIFNNPCGAMDTGAIIFVECLTLLALARKGKRGYLIRVGSRLKRLRHWALHAPQNFLGKQLLVEAELAAVRGKHLLALSKYRSAIIDSRDAGLLMQEALANERLAKYYLECGNIESAAPHIQEAIRVYTEWGGVQKANDLKNELGMN